MTKNPGKMKKFLTARREFYDQNDERVYELEVLKLKPEFMNQLTRSNMALLGVVRDEKPDSIYQLAKMLNQDQPRVQKQCKQLADLGFLELVKHAANGRVCMKPQVNFKRLVIRIDL